MTYSNILALIKWIGGKDLPRVDKPDFGVFSQMYVAFIMFAILVPICLRRDLSIFVSISSYGAIAIIFICLIIMFFGIYGFTNTSYKMAGYPTKVTK